MIEDIGPLLLPSVLWHTRSRTPSPDNNNVCRFGFWNVIAGWSVKRPRWCPGQGLAMLPPWCSSVVCNWETTTRNKKNSTNECDCKRRCAGLFTKHYHLMETPNKIDRSEWSFRGMARCDSTFKSRKLRKWMQPHLLRTHVKMECAQDCAQEKRAGGLWECFLLVLQCVVGANSSYKSSCVMSLPRCSSKWRCHQPYSRGIFVCNIQYELFTYNKINQ